MALFGKTSERLKHLRGLDQAAPGAVQPGPAVQPGTREMRAQAVHRLQVGMFGLAAMLLLVSLASVIMQRVATSDRSTIAAAPQAAASAAPANDPLADLGVAPEVPVGTATKPAKPARPETAH